MNFLFYFYHFWYEITHLYLFISFFFLNKVGLSHRSRFIICFFHVFVVIVLLRRVVLCRLGTMVCFSSSSYNVYLYGRFRQQNIFDQTQMINQIMIVHIVGKPHEPFHIHINTILSTLSLTPHGFVIGGKLHTNCSCLYTHKSFHSYSMRDFENGKAYKYISMDNIQLI